MYSIVGATFGIFLDQIVVIRLEHLQQMKMAIRMKLEVTAGNVYIKELSAPKGYKLDTTVHSLKVEAGKKPY